MLLSTPFTFLFNNENVKQENICTRCTHAVELLEFCFAPAFLYHFFIILLFWNSVDFRVSSEKISPILLFSRNQVNNKKLFTISSFIIVGKLSSTVSQVVKCLTANWKQDRIVLYFRTLFFPKINVGITFSCYEYGPPYKPRCLQSGIWGKSHGYKWQ